MLTKNGICYDLQNSHYRVHTNGITYVFSSQLYKDKFKDKLQQNRDIINYSLTNRFNLPVDVSQLADLVLYKKIEKRGFLIVLDNGEEICQNKNLTFVGGNLTPRNFND